MNVLDIFSGAVGGWSKGLARAGYTTVAACEIDDWRRAVFAAGHPGCRMYADVRELSAEQLHADLGYLPDVVVGSPPCQEISTANCKGTGITDDHPFWEWARIVFEVRPLWCAAENSPNARLDGIDGILDALDQAGYAAWPCLVGADHAGANHRRRRLWLIAADAHRAELWQQSGRSGGAHGRAAASPGRDDPNSNGRFAGGTRRHADGCLTVGVGEDGRSDPNSEGIGHARCGPSSRRPDERPRLSGHALPDARDAESVERMGLRRVLWRSGTEPDEVRLHDAPHSDREGFALGPRLARHDGEELPAALRDIGLAWPHWNGGLAGLAAACAAAGACGLDDGNGPGLPANLRNRAIAALGDAVVPEITYAIGKAMKEGLGNQ